MTSQDPSEVRCPNCGRLTPFAPFCTHCGAVIQEAAAGARPHALDRAELRRITHLLLAETGERLRAQGITLDVTESAVDWLAERGHQPELGARPLRRTIARELDRKLSRMIIAGDLGSGQRVVVDVVDGTLVLQPRSS